MRGSTSSDNLSGVFSFESSDVAVLMSYRFIKNIHSFSYFKIHRDM